MPRQTRSYTVTAEVWHKHRVAPTIAEVPVTVSISGPGPEAERKGFGKAYLAAEAVLQETFPQGTIRVKRCAPLIATITKGKSMVGVGFIEGPFSG